MALGVLDLFWGVEVLATLLVALGVLDLFQGVEVLAGSWVALGVLDRFWVVGTTQRRQYVTSSLVGFRLAGPCPWEGSIETDQTS